MEATIRRVQRHWGRGDEALFFLKPECDGRLICQAGDMVLKGIPLADRPEQVIAGNAAAHEMLGQRGLGPALVRTADGCAYLQAEGYWWYAMEHIRGRQMEETEGDLHAIGRLARQLHGMTAAWPSGLEEDKARFYTWFGDKAFKPEFDAILDGLPDWAAHDRCFVHTDLGPHNTMLREDGRAVLIDLDDAGQGSRHLDAGWPLIMEFVDFNHDSGDMRYRFDLALAYLQGYYGGGEIDAAEYDLLWQGAAQMHISYMQSYGPYAVDSLWQILKFGLAQKAKLRQAASCGGRESHV